MNRKKRKITTTFWRAWLAIFSKRKEKIEPSMGEEGTKVYTDNSVEEREPDPSLMKRVLAK